MSPFLFTTALMIFVSGIPLRGVFFLGGGGSLSGSMLKWHQSGAWEFFFLFVPGVITD